MTLAPDRATRERLRAVCDAVNAQLAATRRQIFWIAAAAAASVALVWARWPEYIQFAAAIAGVITLGAAQRARRKLGAEYKMGLALGVIPVLRPGTTFNPQGSVDVDAFNALELFSRSAERVRAEDEVTGELNGVSWAVEELHATRTETSGSGKSRRTRTVTIFRGVAVRLEFNKHFHGHTIVVPRTFGAGLLGGLFEGRFQTITLENADFERAFVTKSTDDVEARYLLTPRLMELILEAQSELDAEISLAFHTNTLHVLVASDANRFEVSLFSGVSPMQAVTELAEVIELAEQLVRVLDLETRIWTRV